MQNVSPFAEIIIFSLFWDINFVRGVGSPGLAISGCQRPVGQVVPSDEELQRKAQMRPQMETFRETWSLVSPQT